MKPATTPKPGRPPISERVIRVGGAIALIPLLRERGVDVEALFAQVGLPLAAFDHPDHVIPFAKLCQLGKLAADRTGLADLGLRTCLSTRIGALGPLGYLVANSDSVGAGLMCLQTYLHLHDEGAVIFLQVEDGIAFLGYEVLEPGLEGAEQVAFGAMAIAVNMMRELCGDGFVLREVTFAFRAPPDTSAFRAHFLAPLRFDAVRTALAFDAALLQRPIVGADAILREVLMSQVWKIARVESGDVARDRIKRVVRTLLVTGRFSLPEVARAFGMNRRTLSRRLQTGGATFRDLVAEARYEAACGLLRNTVVPLEDIALQLGYSDVTAFTRAFRRWAGTSPVAWRRSGSSLRR